jgi:DNA polymerase-3 subunit alpha
MAAPFTPLHVHSHYSLLKALPKIPNLVATAKEEGCEALALTDLGNLYAAIEFYKECKSAGIKPILGLDAYVGENSHLLLLVKDELGYKNLLKIVTESQLAVTDERPVPIVTTQMLTAHHAGLVAVRPLSERTDMTAVKEIFGEDYYDDVPTQEIFYLKPQDRRAWETMRGIENGGKDDNAGMMEEEDFHFFSAKEMEKKFGNALEKTNEVAAKCNLDLKLGTWYFPQLELPPGTTPDEELGRLIEEGIKARGLEDTKELRERLDYEYGIICKKGYSAYFLVVADLLRFAREHKILTTIRGSVAGSMVTYVTGITNVNPLIYKLPFERFLNPERPSAPDIDMDYADNRRDEVIEYARAKYGDRPCRANRYLWHHARARRGARRRARARLPLWPGRPHRQRDPHGSQGFPMTLERAGGKPELKKMYKGERR